MGADAPTAAMEGLVQSCEEWAVRVSRLFLLPDPLTCTQLLQACTHRWGGGRPVHTHVAVVLEDTGPWVLGLVRHCRIAHALMLQGALLEDTGP